MSSTIVEGFSISDAGILNGVSLSDVLNGDIYGVRSGSIALDTDSYDNTGDDAILSTWYWFTKATVTIQAGYVSLQTLALISGTNITSSGSAPNDLYSLPLWESRQNNVTPQPMAITVPAKDSNGVLRVLRFVLYKVQFQPFSFDGPTYKSGLLLNYTGSALMSALKEDGTAVLDSVTGVPSKAIGRLISSVS